MGCKGGKKRGKNEQVMEKNGMKGNIGHRWEARNRKSGLNNGRGDYGEREKKRERGGISSCDGLQRVGWRRKGKAGREERVRGMGTGGFKLSQQAPLGSSH